MSDRINVGLIGCGAISANYLKNAKNLPILNFVACADLDVDRAKARAEEFSIPRVVTVDELLTDPTVQAVLNLTIPAAHAPVTLRALEGGKHVYEEKPFAVNREEGRQVLKAASAAGLRVGCAPDTVLGAGIQTARKALDNGQIGRPVAFTAFFGGRGPEYGHPNPEFFYEPGGGPMFDMGPYYVTALLNLLGPVRRIQGEATVAIPERTITSPNKLGQKIQVKTPDHVIGTLLFENGAAGTIVSSFSIPHAVLDRAHPIVIYGTEGALKVPDPNTFDGTVEVRRVEDKEWVEIPHAFRTGYGRAVGLADLAHALRTGRPHRCNAEQGFAALDLMQGFLDASTAGEAYEPAIRYERPTPMPADLPFGELD